LESLLTSPVGDVDSPHRKLSHKGAPGCLRRGEGTSAEV